MDLCEMDLLLAMSLYLSGNKEKAFEVFKRALKLVSMYRYYRAVADEGSVMLSLFLDYVKPYGRPGCTELFKRASLLQVCSRRVFRTSLTLIVLVASGSCGRRFAVLHALTRPLVPNSDF